MRVYNMLGRRDNSYKARIKILVHETGEEEMRRMVEEEFAKIDASEMLTVPQKKSIASAPISHRPFSKPCLPTAKPLRKRMPMMQILPALCAPMWWRISKTAMPLSIFR